MATEITFTDSTGAATLNNGKAAPHDRFTNWTPATRPGGETAARQSDLAITMVKFRTEYRVHFELPMIPSSGAGSKLTIADRLVAHLLEGGVCTVTTGDAASSAYANSRLQPGTVPDLRLTDRELMEYTLSLDLLLTSAPVCRYAG